MQNLINTYDIDPVFFRRYFRYNANMTYSVKLTEFLLFKRGSFMNPLKKNVFIDSFTAEGIYNFYNSDIINIAKIDYSITNSCTLRCKDCSNYIPYFNNSHKNDVNIEQFQSDINILTNEANITNLHILGGEPLLHKFLPEITEVAAQNTKIELITIITNGTIIPNADLLNVIQNYNNKVYFYISNYSSNKSLLHLLKYEQIIYLLNKKNIKWQMQDKLVWTKEVPLQYQGYTPQQIRKQFLNCITASCLCIQNGKLHICCKSAAACELGLDKIDDYVDLSAGGGGVKQMLIDFYHKSYFKSCQYCVRLTETVMPAIQIER